MQNRVIGQAKYDDLIQNDGAYLNSYLDDPIVKGDIMRMVELDDNTNNQTGRSCGVVVTARSGSCRQCEARNGVILKVRTLPKICPKSTVKDFWPDSTHVCLGTSSISVD